MLSKRNALTYILALPFSLFAATAIANNPASMIMEKVLPGPGTGVKDPQYHLNVTQFLEHWTESGTATFSISAPVYLHFPAFEATCDMEPGYHHLAHCTLKGSKAQWEVRQDEKLTRDLVIEGTPWYRADDQLELRMHMYWITEVFGKCDVYRYRGVGIPSHGYSIEGQKGTAFHIPLSEGSIEHWVYLGRGSPRFEERKPPATHGFPWRDGERGGMTIGRRCSRGIGLDTGRPR